MNSMNKKLDLVDFFIISISILNICLLIVYQGYSRSLLVILCLITIFFLLRNPLQVILVIVLIFFSYPLFVLLRAFPDQLTINNLYLIFNLFNEYDVFCNFKDNLSFHPFSEYHLSNFGLLLSNCEAYYHFSFTNFYDLPKYIRYLSLSFLERLYGTYEFGIVILNEIYLNKNYYFNNFYALLPSIFIEKPNFFFFQGYQLFEYELKPITDFRSTTSFGIIPESLSILKSYYIFPFLALVFLFNIINYLLNTLDNYNFKIAYSIL